MTDETNNKLVWLFIVVLLLLVAGMSLYGQTLRDEQVALNDRVNALGRDFGTLRDKVLTKPRPRRATTKRETSE